MKTYPNLEFDGTYIHVKDGTRFLAVCADAGKGLGPLFAAAPELLAALESAQKRIAQLSPNGYTAPECWAISAAIARATA